MKRLLLVDDDAVLTRFYHDRLSAYGFHVDTATSGTRALSMLGSAKPDLVVLDLMMPKVSGVEVLKYIRSVPELAPTPVVVLTNTYQNDLGRQAATIGIEKAFLKAQCSPSVLMAAVDEILQPELAAAKPGEPETQPATSLDAPPAEGAATARPDPTAEVGTEEPRMQAGANLLADAATICADLDQLFEALAREPRGGPEERERFQDLFCKVHYLAEAAGQTHFALLAQVTAVFDGLLRVGIEDPERVSPSVVRTVRTLVEVIALIFQKAHESRLGTPLGARVLVVAKDPMANQMVVAALRQAQLNARGIEDSVVAWQWINSEQFDLVVLDIEMPVLDGFQLCERLRRVEGYEKTPVILVAAHDDLETRGTSVLSGADDLVAKPVLPQELVARVVMHLVRTEMQV